MKAPYSAEHKILLLCATSCLLSEGKDLLESLLHEGRFSSRKLLYEAERHGMVPLLYAGLKSLGADFVHEGMMSKIENHYHLVKFTNMMYAQELSELQRYFCEIGVKVILLKGAALVGTVYTDMGLRHVFDIDLFVNLADWKSVNEVLQRQGYTADRNYNLLRTSELCDYALCFRDVGFRKHKPIRTPIDIHLHPNQMGNIEVEELWAKVETVSKAGIEMLCLCPEHQLAHLCVHLNQHSRIRLKWVVDIYVLLQRHKTDFDWNYVIEKFRNTTTGYSIYYTLILITQLFDYSIPELVRKYLIPSHRVMRLLRHRWGRRKGSQLDALKVMPGGSIMTLLLAKRLQDKYTFIRNSIFPPLRWLRCRYHNTSLRDMWHLYFFYFRDVIENLQRMRDTLAPTSEDENSDFHSRIFRNL